MWQQGGELDSQKNRNVSILQELWKYRLIFCLEIKLFLLVVPSGVFQALYQAVVSLRRMSVLVASASYLLLLLYKHWEAIWACGYSLSPSCFVLLKGKTSHAVRFQRGEGPSSELLQPPPSPVPFRSEVFRAKISTYVHEVILSGGLGCELLWNSWRCCCEVVWVPLYGSSGDKDAGLLCWLV